jgi:hypothetical protein
MTTKGRKQFGEFIINNVLTLIADGKTYREISEIYQLGDKRVVEQLMGRYRRKQRLLESGITPRQKGRQKKDHLPAEQDKDMEIKRLKMENELLRSFLQNTGRR